MQKQFVNLIIAIVDLVLLVGLFYITIVLRVNMDEFGFPSFTMLELSDFSFVICVVFILMSYENIYTTQYDFWQDSLKVMKSFALGFLIVLTMLALTKTNLEYSRSFLTTYFLLGLFLMPILKRYVKRLVYSFNFLKINTLVVGTDAEVAVFKKELENNWYLGQAFSLVNYKNVIIVSKGLDEKMLSIYISKYIQETRSLFIVPYITDINFAHSNILEYSNIRYNTIQVENKLLIKKNIWIKNSFDRVATLLVLPFFILLHALIALVIKMDSKGSIFFKQHRLGKDDNDFLCYKYRTMHENSDDILANYLLENPDEVTYYDEYHKYKNDPRITKVGKFLRSSSLDELAQIINVLKGEMSFVGPRPYMLKESCKIGENQEFILKVKPGITGLWQVSGRNDLTFKERNELEVWYIKNWSLWADFVILIKTIKVVLGKVGAR